MPRKNLITTTETRQEYSPIFFADNEVQYSSEDVRLVVEDYYRQAEYSIEENRNRVKCQSRYNKTGDGRHMKKSSDRNARVEEIRKAGDYNWIVSIARSRNEIDPNKDLRVKIFQRRTGGSTYDLMLNYIDDILRKPDKSYEEMSRANFNLKILKMLGEQPRSSINFTINNTTNNNAPEEKPAEKVYDISAIRKEARESIIANQDGE